MWSACVRTGWQYLRAQGVLAVDEETEPNLRPDAEGDATPEEPTPPGTRIPKRRPGLSPGRIQHPLPEPSGQDAEKMARKLADERANLEEQPARNAPGAPSRASQESGRSAES
jgi:hypothetical protein